MKIALRGLPQQAVCFCIGNTNPFFEIYRGSHTDPTNFFKVYDSDVIMGNNNPSFPKFMLKGQQLCNSDMRLPIQFKVYTRDGTENVYLASCTVTLQEL